MRIPGNASTCTSVPAGFFKPRQRFVDTYYICPNGTYSIGGTAGCIACAYATSFGSTACPVPTATPTAAPVLSCPPGTYYRSGACGVVPVGYYSATSSMAEAAVPNCSSAVVSGAARCQSTQGNRSHAVLSVLEI
jgi:hypothetical protein